LFAFRRHVRTGVASACAAAVVVVGVMAWESLGKRIPGVEYVISLFEERGLSERPRLLEAAMDLFEQRPLFGVGIGGFYEQYGRAISLEYPHNFVAAVAAEGGIVGLVLLAMTLAAILSGVRGVSGRSAGQICCLLGAVYIGIASLISGDYYDSRFFWILIIVVINRECRPGTPGGGSSGPARWRQSAPEVLTPRK
jgi:O-antigen ligase